MHVTSSEYFPQAAALALQLVKIDTDYAAVRAAPIDARYITGADTTNQLNFGLTNESSCYPSDVPRDVFPTTLHTDKPFLCNGLLIAQYGRISTAAYGNNETHTASLHLYSSPTRINDVQVALGKTPGEDALKLVRVADAGELSPRDWIQGFANKEVWVADLTHWEVAVHDLHPADHIQSWLAIPPQFCQRIADKAQAIEKMYGEKIDLKRGQRPIQARQFVSGLDRLNNFTHRIVKELYYVHGSKDQSPENSLHMVTNHVEDRDELNILSLNQLGFIKDNLSFWERRAAKTAIAAAFAAHVARQLIILEEVRPRADEDRLDKIARIDVLHHAVKKYAHVA